MNTSSCGLTLCVASSSTSSCKSLHVVLSISDYNEDVEGGATQRVGPREESFKDDKSDENVDLKHN